MESRPTALTVVAALNRMGAVAVLMRPDGDVAREAELGEINRVVADPEHMAGAGMAGVQVLVLGGGAKPRDLGPEVFDMERIDPDVVELPGWYKPNPGRARELAFILFTGSGERTRPNRITNRRWILSALGTASSAALTDADTVYSVTPVYHPSGLMVSLGGAMAGFALTTRTELLLIVVGGLFVAITASVILQVAYFKVSKGKRIFRMAPLQHHFELLGWAEITIVVRFWIIGGLCVITGLGIFYWEWVAGV